MELNAIIQELVKALADLQAYVPPVASDPIISGVITQQSGAITNMVPLPPPPQP